MNADTATSLVLDTNELQGLSELHDASLAPTGGGHCHGSVSGLREGRRNHRYVRQRHQRDVP
jgi:hypothetical protein